MTKAYLQISLQVSEEDRQKAIAIFTKHKPLFLTQIAGATSKDLLLHVENVQVLHGFSTKTLAQEYLMSDYFNKEVVASLQPFLTNRPDIRIYSVY